VVNHDVVLHTTGGAYVVIKPQDGWIAHVADEDENYQYQGSAWVQLVTKAATQAQQESASSNLVAATPSNLKWHPGVAKAWVVFDGSGTVTVLASHNVSSVTDNGVGDYTVNFTTAFSSAFYVPCGFAQDAATQLPYVSGSSTTAPTASSCRVRAANGANSGFDADLIAVAFFGDFA
jgi:hypothetical protein